jgi:hypothetical protein
MSGTFDLAVGIDYSGADTPEARLPGLQVYAAAAGQAALAVRPGDGRHWSRRTAANWLRDTVLDSGRVIIGVDHGFAFPVSYFDRVGLKDWPEFLEDFTAHWPTDREGVTVRDVREGRAAGAGGSLQGRTGSNDEFRLCERWTASAKSVFLFDVQGSVASSTHAGLPWLRWLRRECGSRLFWWPFDGWVPPADVSVIAEAYPTLVRRRYEKADRSADAQDAFAVAQWLRDMDDRGALARFWMPPLDDAERATAEREGWILGVT